ASGEYILAAVPRDESRGPVSDETRRTPTPSNTHYPPVVSMMDAQPIPIEAGAQVSQLVITVQRRPVVMVSGDVVGEAGMPPMGAEIDLEPKPAAQFVVDGFALPKRTTSVADGRFAFHDVTEGTYNVTVRTPGLLRLNA